MHIKLFFISFFILNLFVSAYSAPGDLDGSFGTNGIVITQTGNLTRANALASQPDGKIVVVGSRYNSPYRDFITMRFNTDGTLDNSFDGDGMVVTSVGPFSDIAWDVAIQPDGKIVVVGDSDLGGFAVVRYNSDGSPDTTFDNDGKVNTPLDGSSGRAEAVAIQPDGKIIVIGLLFGTSNGRIAVARFNQNGSLDTTFGNNGRATTTSSFQTGQIYDVALQSNGKIVVCGYEFLNGTTKFAAARYNVNGTFDTSFDGDGVVVTPSGGGSESAYSVVVQADGKIILGGNASDFTLVRYNENGSIDNSFGTNGKVFTPISNSGFGGTVVAVNVQSNGKIIAAGTTLNAPNTAEDFFLVRYNPNGMLDTSFGTGGKVITAIGGSVGLEDYASDAVLQANGKIVVAGSTGQGATGFNFAVARYLNNSSQNFDYDGDSKADVSVFRPSNGVWYLQQSSAGFVGVPFGANSDLIVPADYDGDGKTDLAVFRPSNGIWYLQQSTAGFAGVVFGANGDIPMPADYDGDGKADLAVFRPSNGTWYLQQSTAGFTGIAFGANGDVPVAADYDGDGKADIAVFRPSNGTWYLNRSQLGFTGIVFGASGDKPTAADYDGDGKADVAVFRPSNGTWYLQQSVTGFNGVVFGTTGDLPVAADYDGDGKADISVFRPSNGTWYLNRSMQGFTGVAFGALTDKPTPNAFVP